MLELNKVPFSTYKRFPGLVKSVPLVVKCFPIRDPFAPLVDLGWPSQARATKIHAWCKWITHGKTFHYSGNWFHSGNAFTVEKRNIVLHPSSESSKSSKRPKSLFTGCSPYVYYFVLHPSSESSKCWKTSYF